MKKLARNLIYLLSIFLILVGIDKFIPFTNSCTLAENANPIEWYIVGVIEIVAALLLLTGKWTRTTLVVLILLMISAIYAHIAIDTSDIGGAVFALVICIVILILTQKDKISSNTN